MPPVVHVRAPSRLHLGMFSFGHDDLPAYGGVGVMVDRPGLEISLTKAPEVCATGPLAARAVEAALQALAGLKLPQSAGCAIDVLSAPRSHAGLGSGTQLALAVAAGLHALYGLPQPPAMELARMMGRAQRSAIGTYGFAEGGLLVEAGKLPGDALSPLIARVPLPEAWRFVLLARTSAEGLSGEAERLAFAALPPVPRATTDELHRLTHAELLPAAQSADFGRFSTAMFEYGRLAGECFARAQQGRFACPAAWDVIERLQALGYRGIAQTSWGPTVAVLTHDDATAQSLVAQWQSPYPVEIVVAAPWNRAAEVGGGGAGAWGRGSTGE